jgi:hypothetical protein
MLFDEAFVESLRSDPVQGVIELCSRALNDEGGGWESQDVSYKHLSDAYALLKALKEAESLPLEIVLPGLSKSRTVAINEISSLLIQVRKSYESESDKLRVENLTSRYKTVVSKGFVYEFSKGDLEAVQERVNELRLLISSVKGLEKEHQQRLLRRLEKLQGELHKKVSDLDRFWGLIGDAGVVMGKLGDDAKPIVDRMREIADIVWRTQSRAEELPSGTELPRLENKRPPEA